MCKSVALLSGKGGSGKTTLALSMATMLSNCGIRVLLIDCDLSTNGATYFYEEKMAAKKSRITSFYDVLFSDKAIKLKFVEISNSFDFMPSITQVTKKATRPYVYKTDSSFSIYNEICQRYDVVLFDCQAGYTDILKLILPYTDIDLIVMETDAISSAAIRSLYLKIGDIVNEKKLYQVFNKASKEEYEIYSKVSGGTVFTNIDTILFDWKIRKAFSVSQIPDMENTSAHYGSQIYNLCNILFTNKTIQDKLKRIKAKLDIHSNKEQQYAIQAMIAGLDDKYTRKKNNFSKSLTLMISLISILTAFVAFVFGLSDMSGIKETYLYMLIPIILALGTTILSVLNLYDTTKDKRAYNEEISSWKKQLLDLERQQAKLEQALASYVESKKEELVPRKKDTQ